MRLNWADLIVLRALAKFPVGSGGTTQDIAEKTFGNSRIDAIMALSSLHILAEVGLVDRLGDRSPVCWRVNETGRADPRSG